MANNILYAALMFLCGWLWYFLVVRQFVFNFTTVKPMLKRIQKATVGKPDVISVNASRFTTLSIVVWIVISIITAGVVVYLCRNKAYLFISFFIGALIGVVTFLGQYTEYNERNFNDFCSSYYRFVYDDQLRTSMYHNKIPAIKVRLDEMGIDKTIIIPVFKK